ncbi:MAG TPA: oligosaccharide flippase family protein [Tepidisphaeraceae bacterium]|nr:oligosaccharide flippase family protein [Tepidisphaeraceae bacterium]
MSVETTAVAEAAPVVDYASPAKTTVKQLAKRAAVWAFVGYAGSVGLRLVSNMVLTRLLFPSAFALMGLAQIFISGLQMLTDVGVQTGIIQSKHGDDPKYLNTAWTVQVVRGLVLCFIAAALGWPISLLYKEPSLTWLLPAVGVAIAVMGWKSTNMISARRNMNIGRVTLVELLARLAALVVMVIWGWYRPSVMTLVGGAIVHAIITVIFSHTILPGIRNWFAWDRAAAADLASLGKWVVVSTALTFAANQSDRLILGKLLNLDVLGVLMVAYTLYSMPRELVMTISGSIILPAASRKADLPRHELREKMLRNRRPVLLALALMVALLAVGGDWAVRILYDKRYAAAAWIFPVLALGLWPRFLDITMHDALTAIRKLHYNPAGSVLRIVVIGTGLPIAFHYFGLAGAVVVIALGDVPNYLAGVYGLKRHGLLGISQDLLASGLLLGVLAAGLAVRMALGLGTPFAGGF